MSAFFQKESEVKMVLIDTWWNVNINNYDSHTKSTTF